MKKLFVFTLLVAVSATVTGRLMKDWRFQEMFDKSDLVVIASPVATEDTGEKSVLPGISPPTRVLGLSTEFEAGLVLKGNRKLRKFVLHHYRLEHEEPVMNGPQLVTFNSKEWTLFLLFLIREADGRYAPVTGQTDPGLLSVIELKGASLPSLPPSPPAQEPPPQNPPNRR